MQTFGVKDYTNQTPSKHFTGKKMSKFKTPKNEKKNHEMYTKEEVHSFNVWTTIMQSLNIKEWKLFKLQITQTRPPPPLRISDGKNV